MYSVAFLMPASKLLTWWIIVFRSLPIVILILFLHFSE